MVESSIKLGIVGARGHTGAELIALVANHPRFELAFVSSRALAGQRVADQVTAYRGDVRYVSLEHGQLPTLQAATHAAACPLGSASTTASACSVGSCPCSSDT